ncbi:hypothetical protein G3I13_03835 [Streptomyces sp. SID6673]|nr:hypothetical protein [Streptomyces sp. SID11726]NEB23456.1 hypothetical protein [Streptomyces sp. SID6673]
MELFRTQRILMWTATLMAALVVVGLCAMAVDDRMLLGVSVWAKPVKFGVAFALYTATLAWLLDHPHRGRRWTRVLAPVFAATAVIDVGFIVVQAARGTFSHFNSQADPVNSVGQVVFTTGVPGLFFANLLIACILLWQRIGDPATTVAIRAGLVISVVGMALGYLVGFAGPQVARTASGELVTLSAKHTFGAPDGTPGMPITGWSLQAGDLRIPHFLGLHGMQILLLLTFVLMVSARRVPRMRDQRTRTRIVGIASGGYASAVAITLWQALHGQSLVHPDAGVLCAWAVVAAICVAAAVFSVWAGPAGSAGSSGGGEEFVDEPTLRAEGARSAQSSTT